MRINQTMASIPTLKHSLALALHVQAQQLVEEAGQAWPESLQVKVEQPASMQHGDYASNAAMLLAKTLRQPPMQIATALVDRLLMAGTMAGLVKKVEAVSPGFVNWHLDWLVWAQNSIGAGRHNASVDTTELEKTIARASPQTPPKVLVEHTSINPNKAAHIGHLRNSCIGDTLARLYRRLGYKVEVHNYIDDLGNQLADTVVGLLHTGSQAKAERFGDYCWDTYAAVNRAYAVNPELTKERTRILHELEAGQTSAAWLGELVAEKIVREHVEEMGQFGIRYDVLVWESHLVRQGFWAAAAERLQSTPAFVQVKEGKLAGCWVLKAGQGLEGHGDAVTPASSQTQDQEADHQADKVLVRSNGILTYTAKDIAYHLWKFGLLDINFTYSPFMKDLWTTARPSKGSAKRFGRADIVLNVIDSRQEYPQAMVKQALD
ncbi:MAG: arginyl-tRNA synthetase [Paenibacillus sp.]|nr:arginyl-tRNA synthetase [Paenibacillus sp.]